MPIAIQLLQCRETQDILRTPLGLIGLLDRPLIASMPSVQNVHPSTSEGLHTSLRYFRSNTEAQDSWLVDHEFTNCFVNPNGLHSNRLRRQT